MPPKLASNEIDPHKPSASRLCTGDYRPAAWTQDARPADECGSPKVWEIGPAPATHFRVRVGGAFSGGGSVPFEAARIGYDSFGSDLSPVAAVLSWAAVNIIGGGCEIVINQIINMQT